MDREEKQHYVPKVLLKNFASATGGNQIFVFDKSNSKSFKTNIGSIAKEGGFYDFLPGMKGASLEPVLGKLETEFQEIVRILLEKRSLAPLTQGHRSWLSIFVAAQILRVPAKREAVLDMDRQFEEHIRRMGHDPDRVENWRPIRTKEEAKKFSLMFFVQNLQSFADIIFAKDWFLFHQDSTDAAFWIGDNPVVLHNDIDLRPRGNIGLAVPGIQIYLPVSSQLVLGMWCPSIKAELVHGVKRWVENHKKLQTRKILYGKRKRASVDDKLKLISKSLLKPKVMLEYLREGLVPSSAENIEFMNSMQVLWAERYIMSGQSDFSLAERMISDDSNFRQGKRMTLN